MRLERSSNFVGVERRSRVLPDQVLFPPIRPVVKKVLVVDDEPALREIVTAVLVDEGYEVVSVADGQMALEHLVLARPDLILMDVMMPGLNGHETFRAIHASVDLRRIPVVMMSAAATRASLDPSISGYISKPFDLECLLALIARLTEPAAQ